MESETEVTDLRIPAFLARQRNAPADDDDWISAGDQAPPQPDVAFVMPPDDEPQRPAWWVDTALVLASIVSLLLAIIGVMAAVVLAFRG